MKRPSDSPLCNNAKIQRMNEPDSCATDSDGDVHSDSEECGWEEMCVIEIIVKIKADGWFEPLYCLKEFWVFDSVTPTESQALELMDGAIYPSLDVVSPPRSWDELIKPHEMWDLTDIKPDKTFRVTIDPEYQPPVEL